MRIVIKLSGGLLADTDTVRAVARQVTSLAREGRELLVVHGGAGVLSATLKRMGIQTSVISGFRVIDRETRDIAVMVFAGLLNKRLAAAISAAGHPAIGISAADASCFLAEPLTHDEVEGGLGFLGYLTGLNATLLSLLWRAGLVPVAPCLGLGADNELYDINPDHMAAACAEYLNADQLIYLTEVAGVLDGERVLPEITTTEIERLIQARVLRGDMVLKLEAAKRALQAGVREVHIVGGRFPDSLLRVSCASKSPATNGCNDPAPGTRLLSESPTLTGASAMPVAHVTASNNEIAFGSRSCG